MKRGVFVVLSGALFLLTGIAAARDVVIVTSFPKELFETYKKTFEAKHPGTTVVINSKQTNAGVTYLRETRAKPEADIFWVSAPDAFQTLDSDGLLEKYSPPKEWTDLTDPRYYNHLVISAPSRSGTTHLTIETILQAYGWEKGWALLLNAGGNMGAITERSFGVPEAVISGQYGIGVVIDFFGLSAIASGNPVDFAYPSLTSVVPASVALVKGGPNPEAAGAFVHYLLGEEGQMLLFSPKIGRLPVIPDLYARGPKEY